MSNPHRFVDSYQDKGEPLKIFCEQCGLITTEENPNHMATQGCPCAQEAEGDDNANGEV